MAKLLLVLDTHISRNNKDENNTNRGNDASNLKFNLSNSQKDAFQEFFYLLEEEPEYDSDFDNCLPEKIKTTLKEKTDGRADNPEIFKEFIREAFAEPRDTQSTKIRLNTQAAWPFFTSKKYQNSQFEKFTKEVQQGRIIFIELTRFCIANNSWTPLQKQLLQYFAETQGIDNDYFEDLLKQAQATQKEIKKTINLILE